jgi:hypothetical protein
MAVSTSTLSFSRATVAASGTSVAPGTAIPDNCVEVILTNRIAAVVTFALGAAGGALADDGTNGVLLASGVLVLSIDQIKNRAGGPDIQTLIFDCPTDTGSIDLTYRCVSASAVAG